MTSQELFTMGQEELNRYQIIVQVCNQEMKQSKAAKLLNVSVRQVKRLCRTYRQKGAAGLMSRRRGKPSHNRLSKASQQQIVQLAKEDYHDFGPTFMAEKLLEHHQIRISKERLRQLLIAEGLWKSKCKRDRKIYQQRNRRSCFGELLQIDGSPHDWFEGRGPKCCLIVFIDDATSEVLYLRFEPAETTFAYFRGLAAIIHGYGLPLSLYSDKHGIFRVNQTDNPTAQTQFGRACEQLGIEIINANSPQAKGRVERSNQTHQDRLVKELRLAKISNILTANVFLETYRHQHNQRFASMPKAPIQAFRNNPFTEEVLISILSQQETRKVTKNLEISFENKIYQIQHAGKGRRLQQTNINVCRTLSDEIILLHQGQKLDYKVFQPDQKRPQIVDKKMLQMLCEQKLNSGKPYRPASSHPWKKKFLSSKPALHNKPRIP